MDERNVLQEIGLRFRKARKKKFKKTSEFLELAGIAASRLSEMESGKKAFKAEDLYHYAEMLDVSPAWLLEGNPQNALFEKLKVNIGEMPVIGRAAADDWTSSRADLEQTGVLGFHKMPYDTKLIQVVGDSMSPLVLDGQYVMIEEPDENPRSGSVVVVEISSDEDNPGFYCKRYHDGGETAIFSSININYNKPFSAHKRNCRIWPVKGVLFAGKGIAPE